MIQKNKTYLVIAAHPDDEVLGCGATIAKLTNLGAKVYTLILGEGVTSRQKTRSSEKVLEELSHLKNETLKANQILQVEKVYTCSFPDNRFDSVDLLDIVKEIENIKKVINPDVIFTHHFGDLNIDHQITHKAVMTAFRFLPGERIQSIYSFEVPSSTDYGNYSINNAFIPNVYVDIKNTMDQKIKAMDCYRSELREYPHPRSLKHINEIASVNGAKVGQEPTGVR